MVSLEGKYTVEENVDYEKYGAGDVVDSLTIPNDIYSLGRLDLWQQHFLNIVSETEFTPDSYFVSEKTFKPIIGLRPFIINGNPKIYTWLQQAGFDCFEDLFPVKQLMTQTNADTCHRLIIETIKQLQKENLEKIYQEIYPRLLFNKHQFTQYATSF